MEKMQLVCQVFEFWLKEQPFYSRDPCIPVEQYERLSLTNIYKNVVCIPAVATMNIFALSKVFPMKKEIYFVK